MLERLTLWGAPWMTQFRGFQPGGRKMVAMYGLMIVAMLVSSALGGAR